VRYARAPEPDVAVAFERQAHVLMAAAAGSDVALDVRDRLAGRRPDLAVFDCMLPAAAAGAEAAGTPAASLVHFLYGPARRLMLEHGSSWTTDLPTLNGTRRALGLAPLGGGPAAWESCDLLLVTAPRWLDADGDFPPNVVHAGPLGIRAPDRRAGARPPRVLLSFSTTVIDGQPALIRDACEAVAATGVQALLTLGPAVAHRDVDAPRGVEILQWGEHDELLPGCAAVVTHAGLGTTLRALAHGIPLLMLPLGRDQNFNATRVTQLGAGIHLPADAGPKRIRAALSELLGDPGFAVSASGLADRIARDRPDRRAAEALERVARPRDG
jgi:UDP:flavonoid glycosyltransferase YjiC (YdhE family)